jgi:hypothetical protein
MTMPNTTAQDVKMAAQAELDAEKLTEFKKHCKGKLREIDTTKIILKNLERELEEMLREMDAF